MAGSKVGFYRHLKPSSFQTAAPAGFGHLAPWDAHLVRIEVHPNAPLVLKRLADAALRVRYGVNIVAIQRGRKSIIPPMPDDVLLPRDELILLGTDEQVGLMKKELDDPSDLSEAVEAPSQYEVKQVRLSRASAFVGKSIRESGIREHFQAMVVGLERDGTRNINPDSDLKLIENDILWVAGERQKLGKLFSLMNPIATAPAESGAG